MSEDSSLPASEAEPDVQAHLRSSCAPPAREDSAPRYRREDARPEERIADLLSLLVPAPEAWVESAKRLPAARVRFDGIVARARHDAEYRARLLGDPEEALEADDIEPTPALRRELIRRLAED
jgi:hypothetical protein